MKHSKTAIFALLLSCASSSFALETPAFDARELVVDATPHADQNWDESEINKPTLEELEWHVYRLGTLYASLKSAKYNDYSSKTSHSKVVYGVIIEYARLENPDWVATLEAAFEGGSNFFLNIMGEYEAAMLPLQGYFTSSYVRALRDERVRELMEIDWSVFKQYGPLMVCALEKAFLEDLIKDQLEVLKDL